MPNRSGPQVRTSGCRIDIDGAGNRGMTLFWIVYATGTARARGILRSEMDGRRYGRSLTIPTRYLNLPLPKTQRRQTGARGVLRELEEARA